MIKWFKRKLRERAIMKNCTAYTQLGLSCGDALSYAYIGEPVGIDKDMARLAVYEVQFAADGFQPLSMREWLLFGGGYMPNRGVELGHRLLKPRCNDDLPVTAWVGERQKGDIEFGDVGSQLMHDGKSSVEGTWDGRTFKESK